MRDVDHRHAQVISELLTQAAQKNQSKAAPSRADHRFDAMERLSDWLAEAPQSELLYVNRFAQKERVSKDVEMTYERLQSEVDVSNKRVHQDKVERDLRVWDLREGWADGRYDPAKEHSLEQIVKDDGSLNSISSARNRYVAAFKRVIGVEYSPENWFWTVGILKLKTTGFGTLSATRPQRTKARRDVAASKVGIDVNAWQPAASESVSSVLKLKEVILELHSDGLSKAEIASKTDLSIGVINTFFKHVDSGDVST